MKIEKKKLVLGCKIKLDEDQVNKTWFLVVKKLDEDQENKIWF
jgi:hypothetical protein